MTSQEIEHVRAAWAADPACRPPQVVEGTPFGVSWSCCDPGWASLWVPPSDREWPAVEALIRDALHRRLLALGGHVQPDGPGTGFLAYGLDQEGSTAWSPDSLISALALAIVALASKEASDAQA